jgi:ATP-dependent DNA helicase 2 subunit 1
MSYSALAFHNAQLEASAFSEEFDPESFEDLTLPKVDKIHKVRFPAPRIWLLVLMEIPTPQRAGGLLMEWKKALMNDESANRVIVTAAKSGTKRKAVSSLFSRQLCCGCWMLIRFSLLV